jgi:predicted transcriptional regulator of viral defense system
MPRPSSLSLARAPIIAHFSNASQKAYSLPELAGVLFENARAWHLAKSTSTAAFISFLQKEGDLNLYEFRSDAYGRSITRYGWGNVSRFELALSIKPKGYFSHGTAAALRGLVKGDPKVIYLNVEQSPKPSPTNTITQESLNLAFSRKQRQSNLIYENESIAVTVVAGKNTKHLGVEQLTGTQSELLPVTNLERTLIDISVRPNYAQGLAQVAEAYRAARSNISVDRLLTTLRNLDYRYPYHQAIGFLLEQTGHSANSYEPLRKLGLQHDFYLAHGMNEREYSKEWRLFYPITFRA